MFKCDCGNWINIGWDDLTNPSLSTPIYLPQSLDYRFSEWLFTTSWRFVCMWVLGWWPSDQSTQKIIGCEVI